jgi:hypothetical protein
MNTGEYAKCAALSLLYVWGLIASKVCTNRVSQSKSFFHKYSFIGDSFSTQND